MTAVQSLIFILMFASSLAAQDLARNVTATPLNPGASDAVAPDMAPHRTESVDALSAEPFQNVSVPSQSHHDKVLDKKFFVVMGGLGAAESLRFTTRKLVLENEFAAGAPWVTRVPSDRHIIATDLPLYATELLVAYELKKSHSWLPGDRFIRRLWWTYPAAMTALHIKNAVGNIRTQGPGGCTSIACAMQMQ
jgi:hypothetical protein